MHLPRGLIDCEKPDPANATQAGRLECSLLKVTGWRSLRRRLVLTFAKGAFCGSGTIANSLDRKCA
jgi:hypothetical protein